MGNNLFYLNSVNEKVGFLLENILTSKVVYMEIPTFDVPPIQNQIKLYEKSYVHGRLDSPVADALVAILFIIGTWMLLIKFRDEGLLMFVILVIPAIILLASVLLPWQRYYLIMQIPYSLIAGVGAGQIWAWRKQFV